MIELERRVKYCRANVLVEYIYIYIDFSTCVPYHSLNRCNYHVLYGYMSRQPHEQSTNNFSTICCTKHGKNHGQFSRPPIGPNNQPDQKSRLFNHAIRSSLHLSENHTSLIDCHNTKPAIETKWTLRVEKWPLISHNVQ